MSEKVVTKEYKSKDEIINSLLNLREELAKHSDTRSREVVFKINSCLFSKYPHH